MKGVELEWLPFADNLAILDKKIELATMEVHLHRENLEYITNIKSTPKQMKTHYPQ